ncbi:MAG: glycosyltransferase [Candidatus Cloacimonetes bacterium]|nr:glycosyltransferase [Candidatus Cloacimonadota bacterium]
MILQIISIIALFSLCFYLYYLMLFIKGLRTSQDSNSTRRPGVTVVIAARNEERNITHLLTALVNQNYPTELFEIIVANDGSSDDTAKVVEQFSKKWENVKLINIQNREKVISPKKNALSQAIENSTGDIIVSTDADCLVGKQWLKAMVACFNDNDMVVGLSQTKVTDWGKARLLHKFEHFDFLAMFAAAAGAISSGKYFSCSGQNIAYKKEAFYAVGGFIKIKHLVSGDDVNLMQLFRKAGMKVKFAYSPHSFVYTKSIENWSQLLSQRSRWTSNMKWQTILNPEFYVYLVSTFFVVVLPFAVVFKYWWLAVGIVILRVIFELSFLRLGYKKFGEEKNRLKFYPLWFILQPVYFILVAMLEALNIFSWKK